jgi:AcrR family transcriptional regulator
LYTYFVPDGRNKANETHHGNVRDVIVKTAGTLAGAHGPGSVTMTRIAEESGIGCRTLYSYFPDVEAILYAWYERQIASHLAYMTALRDRPGDPSDRLAAVLESFAFSHYERRQSELAAQLHRGEHVDHAMHRLRGLIEDLVAEGVRAGEFRSDTPADELAGYCLHAVTVVDGLPRANDVHRMIGLIVDGLRSGR